MLMWSSVQRDIQDLIKMTDSTCDWFAVPCEDSWNKQAVAHSHNHLLNDKSDYVANRILEMKSCLDILGGSSTSPVNSLPSLLLAHPTIQLLYDNIKLWSSFVAWAF